MNSVPKGKIGRLPKSIRDQVNQRLRDGEKGRLIIEWLNSLPVVRKIMAAEFQGRPIREQNLSTWRQFGYLHWLALQEALEMADRIKELATEGFAAVTDKMSTWAAVRYMTVVQQLTNLSADNNRSLKLLRGFCHSLVNARRSDYQNSMMSITRERLAFDQSKLHFKYRHAMPA